MLSRHLSCLYLVLYLLQFVHTLHTRSHSPFIRHDAPRPHILFVLMDDLGWAELGYQRQVKTKEVQTPIIDSLVNEGVILDRHYVHQFCSPSRCAIQSGRAPIHVNTINAPPETANLDDPVGGFAGIPRNMTGLAELLSHAGYMTHVVGKWDVGMATNDHTPVGRGYSSNLIYYHHSNDYWTFRDGAKCGTSDEMIDLWNCFDGHCGPGFGTPAKSHVNDQSCTYSHQNITSGNCVFEDALFEERVKQIIQQHSTKTPLFIFWATHTVHGPLQPTDASLANFSFIDNKQRAKYHSMVNFIDGSIGRVLDTLKQKDMLQNTLIIFSSDNGGPLGSANNFPLKGGKFSNWEGGIRVSAFVSGGFLPAAVHGTKQQGLMTGWDWYATLAGLAGIDPTDHKAAAAKLPPIDSLDMWPLISGANKTSPRLQLEIGSNKGGDSQRRTGATSVGGLLQPPYKLLLGDGPGNTLDIACWQGPHSPNGTNVDGCKKITEVCGRTVETGCLFDVYADPSEYINIAQKNPDIFSKMLATVDKLQKTVYSPNRGQTSDAACKKALENGNFWGPFIFP